jgi:hypothetical protein
MLLSMLDSDADGEIGGAEGASFLRRSSLDDGVLREIWRVASGGTSKPKLARDDFFVACKLVALAQARGEAPSVAAIIMGPPLPLADFHYDLSAEVGCVRWDGMGWDGMVWDGVRTSEALAVPP